MTRAQRQQPQSPEDLIEGHSYAIAYTVVMPINEDNYVRELRASFDALVNHAGALWLAFTRDGDTHYIPWKDVRYIERI